MYVKKLTIVDWEYVQSDHPFSRFFKKFEHSDFIFIEMSNIIDKCFLFAFDNINYVSDYLSYEHD
jgi:hypothetical protein